MPIRFAIGCLGVLLLALSAGCSNSPEEPPGRRFADQGGVHIEPGDTHPPYNSKPATSGWHYSGTLAPAPWGFYSDALPDEVLVHNLEHGGIGVHYDCPEGCGELVDRIAGAVQGRGKIVLSPYPGMESRIALTAWHFLDAFDEFDEDRIVRFIETHESSPNAPEYFVP